MPFKLAVLIASMVLSGCKAKDKTGGEQRGGSGGQQPESHESGEKVVVPSDPKASYYIVQRAGTAQRPIMTTKRIGPSGTSYARRECDCNDRTCRYLAEGDTLPELESAPSSDEKMGPLVDGSITDVMWHQACRK